LVLSALFSARRFFDKPSNQSGTVLALVHQHWDKIPEQNKENQHGNPEEEPDQHPEDHQEGQRCQGRIASNKGWRDDAESSEVRQPAAILQILQSELVSAPRRLTSFETVLRGVVGSTTSLIVFLSFGAGGCARQVAFRRAHPTRSCGPRSLRRLASRARANCGAARKCGRSLPCLASEYRRDSVPPNPQCRNEAGSFHAV